MRAGELRQRITIQQKTITRDTYGAAVETWAALATVWAAVEPMSGREYFQSQQINAEVTTRIRIRHRSDVDSTMRVVFGASTYDIQAVIEPETNKRELQLMCREVVSG